jgi:hypothetical protein
MGEVLPQQEEFCRLFVRPHNIECAGQTHLKEQFDPKKFLQHGGGQNLSPE